MSEQFEPAEFEQLGGIQLGVYAVTKAKEGNLPPDCLDYFRRNASRWDGQHLEMGLMFLSKLDSEEAWHEIANYLGHPLKFIRLNVLACFVHSQGRIDRYVLGKLEERLNVETEEFAKVWLNQLCNKATRRIS